MSAKWLYLRVPKHNKWRLGLPLVILLLVIGCEQADIGRDKSALLVDEAIAEAKLGKQLKINRDALFKGSSEPIRIDAATVMLFSKDPLARKILFDALTQSENSAARVAVCKALSQARTTQEPVKNKEGFIQPLLEILTTEQDFARAKLAAEALLLFEYKQISKPLEKIVTDPSLPAKARLNAIYALRLQPDMRAILKLIELLDDPESQVAAEAEKALRSLGKPIGKDAEARKQITSELKRKGRDEFFRDLLIRQEAQMRKLETELDFWQEQYLLALGKIYNGIDDDAAKSEFLAEHLADSKVAVRLWALEKVSQWRVGTKSKFPEELGPILVNLISDRNRDVRLKTARLLSLMVELNSAEKLLEQLKVEQDDEVKMELFVALGGACSYAFSPNSGINIAKEVGKQTLEWAVKYLSEREAKKAQKGAEVIKKLLEQDGLSSGEVDRYLVLLAERYKQERDNTDGALRGELLSAMAGLCAQESACKTKSDKLFGPLFEAALSDEADLVREASVKGLIYIDRAAALDRLRKGFVNDSSIIVRSKLVELAGEVGGQVDLLWLAEKVGSGAESESAWQAMLKIFRRSDATGLNEWMAKFDSKTTKARLSDEQMTSFLEIAERKAVGENKPEMVKAIREKLALLYSRNGVFERAAEYLGMLRKVAQTAEEEEAILASLLDVYLRWPNIQATAQLIDNCLLERDLEPNNVIVLSIDNYLAAPPAGADPNVILKALVTGVKPPQARPMWAEQVQRWASRLAQAEEPNEPQKADD